MADHIQIGDVSPRIQYTADGSQTVFTYPFPIFADADMAAYEDTTLKTLATDYTVSGAGNSSGGSVTFLTAPANDVTVTLKRNIAIARTSDFQESGEFRSKVINDELDTLTAALQQVDDDVSRSLRLSETDSAGNLELPDKATRIDKALGFDANGDPTVSAKTLAQLETEADNAAASAAAAAVSETNAATSETNASSSASAASTSASNASTSETNAATSETNAATSETNAATSETNAAASYDAFDDRYLGSKTADPTLDNDGDSLLDGALYFNTTANEWRVYDLGATSWSAPTAEAVTSAAAALASETAAATSETNAAASETNAASSASAASTAQTNAETAETNAAASASAASTSETNAATAETNAAASFDSFDDRYLGAKSSDPTLDNDGNALLDGALYWNTTENDFRVYDLGGTSWSAPATLAAASASAASTSETNAGTSETNAAASATSASTAQTNAETAETNAETAETNAETAETNAAGSATAAAASATAAAASAAMGLYKETQVKSAAYTVVSTDEGDLIKVDASGGPVTITLDALATIGVDFRCAVAKSDASANAVTVQRSSTDTINGATSITLTDQYELWDFVGDTSTGLWLGINGTASGITGGDGIDKTGGVLSVDLATDPGLEISGAKLIAKAGTNLSLSAGGIDAPATVGQAEAEAGTATTTRIWTAQRVKQAIDALVTTGASAVEKANIMLNAFRIAINGGLSVQNMVDGVADEYEDETGVDTATSTEEIYVPVGDYYEARDISFLNATQFSAIDTGSFTWTGFNVVSDGTGKHIASGSTYTGDFDFEFDVGTEASNGLDTEIGLATVQGSAGQQFPTTGTRFHLRGNTGCWYNGSQEKSESNGWMGGKTVRINRVGSTVKVYLDDVLEHTYTGTSSAAMYLIIGQQGGPTGFHLDNVGVTTSTPSVDITLVSNATTALAQPDDAFIVLWQEDVDSVTLNTDLKAYASRDGGTTWDLIALTEEATLTTGRILTGSVSLTSSGTSMKYKIETLNDKEQRFHGVALQWS